MDVVADRPHDGERLDLVGALDRPGVHHRGHPIGPVDSTLLELPHQVDVDEVDPNRQVLDPRLLEVVHQGVDELVHLLFGGGAHRTLDPDVGVSDVLLGDPGVVDLEMEPDVPLLVDDRGLAGGEDHVAETWLETVPTGGERRRDVAHVLVVEEQERTETGLLHLGVGSFETPVTDVGPVDAFLPVGAQREERLSHRSESLRRL